MTPEQFYSESKWPEMKDKFDKSAFKFNHYDLCQFAHDYAQQELQAYKDIIKELIPIAERTTITVDNSDWREQWEHKRTVIDRAKTLIDTVTPT